MLTIKNITPLGSELLVQAKDAHYSPGEANGGREGYQPTIGSIWYGNEAGDWLQIRDGMVYVMNDKGSTVAKYDLGGWALPQSEGVDAVKAGPPDVALAVERAGTHTDDLRYPREELGQIGGAKQDAFPLKSHPVA